MNGRPRGPGGDRESRSVFLVWRRKRIEGGRNSSRIIIVIIFFLDVCVVCVFVYRRKIGKVYVIGVI